MNTSENKFKHNYQYYSSLLNAARLAFGEQQIEESIKISHLACEFSSSNYCGFYYESRIEKLLNQIGETLLSKYAYEKTVLKNDRLRILHYSSIVTHIGGHTRLLDNWIKNDKDNQHSLFLGQQEGEIPIFITDTINNSTGILYCHSNAETFVSRIKILYELFSNYDLIVLHHHPYDIIPVIACAHVNIPPVAVLNHGDHKYWVGSSICDSLIEIRDNLIPYDKKRRLIKEFNVLPIPVKQSIQGGYEEARDTLNLEAKEVVLLTIGTEYKYIPFQNKNFFEDIIEVLATCELAKLYVVGISPNASMAIEYAHPRIVFVEATPNLNVYQRACDIYIEGYPFSSFTAYLEVGLLKKPIHYMYDAPLLNKYSLSNYKHQPFYYTDKKDWQDGLIKLIGSPVERLRQASNIYNDILNNHVTPMWNNYLTSFYQEIKFRKHCISIAEDSEFILTDNEVYLDKIISHNIISIFDTTQGLSIKSKVHLAYDFFVIHDYFSLMFQDKGINTIHETVSWSFSYKLGFLYRALISKKFTIGEFFKFVLSHLKSKYF